MKVRIAVSTAAAFMSASLLFALAQGDGRDSLDGIELGVSEHETYGAHVVDAEQMSLYLFLEDEQGVSNCYGQCAENWPPLLLDKATGAADETGAESGAAEAGDIDREFVGTIERDDGSGQVTYNGWPLYHFVRDEDPGDAIGQGVRDAWYLISSQGEPIRPAAEAADEAGVNEPTPDEAETDDGNGAGREDQAAEGEDDEAAEVDEDELFAQLMNEGEEVFRDVCSACHGAQGQGGAGPRLDGRSMLKRSFSVINTILWGIPPAMPSFADEFTDREVAAVATYVRNSWSNDHGIVVEEEVSEWREKGTR